MSTEVTSPFPVFYDRNGQPLDAGYIYIGTPGLNPEVAPITVYWDTALTIVAAQPIRTLAGYPSRDGSRSAIIVNQTSYSIVLRDKNGALVYSDLNISTDLSSPFIDIASASITDIGSVASNNVRVTGTTIINSFGTANSGVQRTLRFAASLTIVNNATSLILPASANIVTAANDTADFVSLGSGNWICTSYKRSDIIVNPTTVSQYGITDALSYDGSFASLIRRGTSAAGIAAGISSATNVVIEPGAFTNTTTAITLPLAKSLTFEPGASLTSSGGGSFTNNGTLLRTNYNPSAWSAWNAALAVGNNYEGYSVELGNYGVRNFGTYPTPSAISGAVNVPAGATMGYHANALSGWVKNSATAMGAVALYGEATRTAASALIWGLNTRTIDAGFGSLNVWGYEGDFNIDNTTTIVLGCDMIGASTVEPTLSIAYYVEAIGFFASPKKRWQYGFRTADAAAIIGVEVGAQLETASGPQNILGYYRNVSDVRTKGYTVGGDSGGNMFIRSETNDTLFDLQAYTGSAYKNNVRLYKTFTGINNSGTPAFPLDVVGAIKFSPGTSVTPPSNGDVVIEFTNNSTLTFKGKGTDGTVRTATLTLL